MLVKPGIYVAFDRFGNHFGYARHPDNDSNTQRVFDQKKRVEALQAEAIRRGGMVQLLSLEEFDSLILLNASPAGRASADNNVAA